VEEALLGTKLTWLHRLGTVFLVLMKDIEEEDDYDLGLLISKHGEEIE
jgi:hypothetical protein